MDTSDPSGSRSRVWWGIGVFLAGVFVWVLFFDSHSLLQRYHWQQELEATQRENAALREDIERLRTQLDRPLSDSAVERIAREEYGMKRPNETIYRVEPE
ncbi:MAG: septation ring formation regulator EzrA [Bacteroidetes bacterium QH_2_64_26]|nr:MAG: septation ring formation regulator EzrA [Bacteroidetes bacterium QH_10_64_19]PSQ70170.1 MAG: septation ring formation regulator EzrA [Bacteroidetes bacterium QH_2_64_26]PSQ73155.1 MAG: septation ring formation regulator EzrA [Bacteroidetes bacterium QH_9_64_21]PSQ81378.1 MAG: septation ring formation regulator EzrA [Bacteroidetes bacterium QS_1_63_11]